MSEPVHKVLPAVQEHATVVAAREPGGDPAAAAEDFAAVPAEKAGRSREVGGPEGPDPTRYGDWERKGRCIDF